MNLSPSLFIRELIDKYFILNKNNIEQQFIKDKISEIEQRRAREKTRRLMSKLMFSKNVKITIKSLLKQGLNEECFEEFLFAWVEEAEAKGYDGIKFLEIIKKEVVNYEN